jgi:uncharacterized membrane protein YfcA
MDTVAIIIFLVFGVLFGIISSIAGIGGGGFYMSLMILLLAIPINEARDTSTFIIVFFSFVAFISYYRQGKIDIKLSLIFAVFALLGSITATLIFKEGQEDIGFFLIDNTILKFVIASVILISGLNMIRKALKSLKIEKMNRNNRDTEFSLEKLDYKANLKKGIPLFFLAGIIAYLSGIGGGMLFVPTLNFIFGIPIHFATAMSSAMIFFIGIYNAIIRVFTGGIQYLVGILIASGAIIGSILGAEISGKMHRSYLQFFVAAVLIILAIRLYFI